MAGLNKVMIIGNLGRDPEVTYTQGGSAVCKFTVATSEEWNDKQSGEKKTKTEWHRITAFGKQAETIGQYMVKGSQIYVEGKLQTSQYEKDGVTRYSTDIIVEKFQFIGSKQQSQQPQNNGYQHPQQNQYAQQPGSGMAEYKQQGFKPPQTYGYQEPHNDNSDIPF